MAGGLRYESGRDMPPGMQIAAAREFLCREAGVMLAALQDVDAECKYCLYASMDTPCTDQAVATACTECEHEQCPCHGCEENSKYKWCGAEKAQKRLLAMRK